MPKYKKRKDVKSKFWGGKFQDDSRFLLGDGGWGEGGRALHHGENVAPVRDENTNKEWLAPTRPWGYF